MNIGVLYPRSTAHPGMNLEFMDGFRSCLRVQGLSDAFTIVAENAGFGGVDKEVIEKIEKLLIGSDAEILVLYIDLKMFAMVKPMLEASGKLVVIVNPGADYPQTWMPSPNVVHLSLNHSFLCWLTGRLAGREKGARAAMATSFYDCGYLHSAMMVSSFNLRGGSITFNYVNNQAYKEGFHINELIKYLEGDEATHKLLCIYDELPARLVYKALNTFEDAGLLQLFVSPMMLHDSALDLNGAGYKFSIEGYMPWLHPLQNKANEILDRQVWENTGKPTSIFTLLGWEVALLLQKAVASSLNLRNGSSIVEYLCSVPLDTPRGGLYLDTQTHWYLSPFIKRSVRSNTSEIENTFCVLEKADWQEYVDNPPQGVVSGWTNTYLCY